LESLPQFQPLVPTTDIEPLASIVNTFAQRPELPVTNITAFASWEYASAVPDPSKLHIVVRFDIISILCVTALIESKRKGTFGSDPFTVVIKKELLERVHVGKGLTKKLGFQQFVKEAVEGDILQKELCVGT